MKLFLLTTTSNQHPHKAEEGSYWSGGLGQVDINIDWRPGSLSGILLAAVDMIFLALASHYGALVVINLKLPLNIVHDDKNRGGPKASKIKHYI